MRALPLTLALLVPLPALACPEETVLSCQIGRKVLELCSDGIDLTYRFGPRGAPELQLSAALADGPVEPWPGFGSTIWEVTRFANGPYTYEVWLSVEKPRSEDDDPPLMAGVNVVKGEQGVADLSCEPGTLDTDGVFAMSDAMAAAGYCWNFDAQHWQEGGC